MKASLLVAGTLFLVSTALGAVELKCTSVSIDPESTPNFLIPAISPPKVGESIVINTESDELTQLHFSEGGAIPLEEVEAKLTRQEQVSDVFTLFSGTHASPSSVYTGTALFTVSGDVASGLIQVHKLHPFRGQSLYTMRLDCSIL